MKASFYIFLIFYILYMEVRPCVDEGSLSKDQVGALAAMQPIQYGSQESAPDMCTPFCSCACCSAHVQVGSSHGSESMVIRWSTVLQPACPSGAVTGAHLPIWQPPRA